MAKKNIGIVLQYYELRDDIPPLLNTLSNHCNVVLFAREKDLEKVNEPFEKRAIPDLPNTIPNKIWSFLYLLGGNIPQSRENYRSWCIRRIALEKSRWSKIKLRIILEVRSLLGGLINFDKYLAHLEVNCGVRTDDLDAFLAMSDVYDVNLLTCILRSDKPLFFYIYSWDHIAKHHKFSHRVEKYLTWHQGITEDLTEIHKIDPSTIIELGSTQLSLVHDHLNSANAIPKTSNKIPFVYYACTWGCRPTITQEINLIKWLAETLFEIAPDVLLVVRPYPNAKMFDQYQSLLGIENIQIENIDIKGSAVIFEKDGLTEKYRKINEAALLIHSGSTIGLEAAYFDTPVVFLAPADFDYGLPPKSPHHLLKLFQQRHLQKYMLGSSSINIVRNRRDLAATLQSILKNPDRFLEYNRELSSLMILKSRSEISSEFIEHVEEVIYKKMSSSESSSCSSTLCEDVNA